MAFLGFSQPAIQVSQPNGQLVSQAKDTLVLSTLVLFGSLSASLRLPGLSGHHWASLGLLEAFWASLGFSGLLLGTSGPVWASVSQPVSVPSSQEFLKLCDEYLLNMAYRHFAPF